MNRFLSKYLELKEKGYQDQFFKGFYQSLKYRALRKRFSFDPWHLTPIEWRPYGLDIIKFVNTQKIEGSIVEIGCGLGDITRRVAHKPRYGYDVDSSVINAATYLSKDKGTAFIQGSFESVGPVNATCLIMVNFTHNLETEYLKKGIDSILEDNPIDTIIVDEIDGPSYKYHHQYGNILKGFYEHSKIGSYKGGREVLVFKRVIND